MERRRSNEIVEAARGLLPGGVDSPVRAFKAVGGEPVVMAYGSGSRIHDVDGNEYIDYVGSWGPLILGHAEPAVIGVVQKAAARGLSFGATTELEVELGRLLCNMVPSVERVRFVSSGTEATMSAIRLARAFTGRDKILKFEGCYHGHSDGLLAKAGSGIATLALPDSAGVPASFTAETLVAPFNDPAAVDSVIDAHGDALAAIIVEPVPGNMGLVPPADGFLRHLREACDRSGALLIFDEVISGFRIAAGGAQMYYGVLPDLTCLGKIIGGGMPVGAYGGRAEIMALLAPEGPVYQAGTLSGNPVSMAAGIVTLRTLQDGDAYRRLDEAGAALAAGLREAAAAVEAPVSVQQLGSMLTIFFADSAPHDYASAKGADTDRYARFFRAMLDAGLYLPPSQFETMFVSLAHTPDDIDRTIEASREAFAASR